MTTIRKIVTSKIDGDDSNNTTYSEIRPFGELAVYIDNDNNGGPDKLELLMFDGVRTHLRSKVLAKGTFYGGDADSADQGDGIENFDAIKLIPDAELHYNDGEYGNDQYIVIDPTFPNHIHVRAGGAIDASTATLFLGGELNNVRVSDGDDQVVITTNDTHTWLFGDNGTTTFPDDSVQTTAWTGTVSTPAIGAAKNIIVIQSASSILNTRFASLPPAAVPNYAVPGTGIVVNVAWSTNGEDYHSPGFTVVNGGSGHTGGGEFGGGTVLTVPYADMGISGGGNWTWYVVDVASDIVLTTGLSTWRFGGDGNLSLPNPDDTTRSQIRSSNDGMQTIFETFNGGQVTKLTLDYDASEVQIQSFPGIEWTFGETGTLNLPNNSPKISSGNGLQIGSTTNIATDSSEGTGAGTPGVVDVPFDGTLINTYPAGSTITFQNDDVRTITSISQVSGYLEISYSGTATASSPEFPITLKTANFVAAYTPPEWTFGTDGALTLAKDIIVGNNGGHIYQDAGQAGNPSSIKWVNMTGANNMLRVFADDRTTMADERLNVAWDDGNGFTITTYSTTDSTWTFGIDGTLTLPGSIIGTATQNVFNTMSTTVNAFGAATTLNIGVAGGTTTIAGDLTVSGTTTTINSTTLTVDDKNIELGSVATPTDTTADGGGITLKGATDKTFNWVNATGAWTSSEDLNLVTGKAYEINGVAVLSATSVLNDASQTSVTIAGSATTALTIGASGAPITGFARTATTASTASSLGYLGLPQSATSTTATLAIGDVGKHIYVTTNSQTITIPANSSVAYPIGTTLTFIAGPSPVVTVSIAIATDTMRLAGGALTGTRTLAANGMATAVKVAATTWYINGTGLT